MNQTKINLSQAKTETITIIKMIGLKTPPGLIDDITANIYYLNDLIKNKLITEVEYNNKMLGIIDALTMIKESEEVLDSAENVKETNNLNDNKMYR